MAQSSDLLRKCQESILKYMGKVFTWITRAIMHKNERRKKNRFINSGIYCVFLTRWCWGVTKPGHNLLSHNYLSWWRHQMEIFSALLALCAGNSPVSGEVPSQRLMSFDVFFDLCSNKRLSKQSWGWWFETLSHPLWRHCNVTCSSPSYYHNHATQNGCQVDSLGSYFSEISIKI